MNKIARLNPVQLFGLLVGVPIIFSFIFPDTTLLEQVFYNLARQLIVIFYAVWMCAVIIYVQPRLPEKAQANIKQLNLALLLFSIGMLLGPQIEVWKKFGYDIKASLPILFIGISIVLILGSLSFIYIIYRCARSIKTAEQQKPIGIFDALPDVIFLLIPYIGVWFIAPRVNKPAKLTNPLALYPERITSE